MDLFDFLFPKYCVACKRFGSFLCPDCFAMLSFTTGLFCAVCNRQSLNGLTHPACRTRYAIDGIFASITYNNIARKLLYVFKYKPYVTQLSELLGNLLYEGLIQQEEFVKALGSTPLLVPIPLAATKQKRRGYNHAQLLGSALAKLLRLKQKAVLLRIKPTHSQYGLNRKERIQNIHGAFAFSPGGTRLAPPNIPPTVFVVDDIVTTGSTLLEAAKVLKRSGVQKVWGIALASALS